MRTPLFLPPFYADDADFYGSARQSVEQLRLMMDWGPDRGYLYEPVKLRFISVNPEEEEAARQECKQAGLNLNCVGGSQ